ncbi:MAG: rod shape-determining protein MreC [Christensenellaceae bacterium]|jgi:rod shape-determining protein MreC
MRFLKNKPLVITIILIILLLTLLIATTNTDEAKGPVSFIGRLVAPVQRFFYGATETIGGLFESSSSKADLLKENTTLKERVTELEAEVVDYDTIYAENQRLKDLLGFVETLDENEIVTAQVIKTTPGMWFEEFTINVGTDHGIEKDMMVYAAGGFVGRVVYTAGNYSRVLTLLHDDIGVPVLIERTRDNGVVKPATGTSDAELLQVVYLSADADVIPGDKVITSGLGGVYEKGIHVGTVTQVSQGEGSEKIVHIKSDVDFKHIEEVTVVLKKAEE